ncbi:hypothetical protein Pelo_16888 [Pelomyxa schiedti]|nr:hypothetical protein Pelo_16888 [Pelomyxa schiedti]
MPVVSKSLRRYTRRHATTFAPLRGMDQGEEDDALDVGWGVKGRGAKSADTAAEDATTPSASDPDHGTPVSPATSVRKRRRTFLDFDSDDEGAKNDAFLYDDADAIGRGGEAAAAAGAGDLDPADDVDEARGTYAPRARPYVKTPEENAVMRAKERRGERGEGFLGLSVPKRVRVAAERTRAERVARRADVYGTSGAATASARNHPPRAADNDGDDGENHSGDDDAEKKGEEEDEEEEDDDDDDGIELDQSGAEDEDEKENDDENETDSGDEEAAEVRQPAAPVLSLSEAKLFRENWLSELPPSLHSILKKPVATSSAEPNSFDLVPSVLSAQQEKKEVEALIRKKGLLKGAERKPRAPALSPSLMKRKLEQRQKNNRKHVNSDVKKHLMLLSVYRSIISKDTASHSSVPKRFVIPKKFELGTVVPHASEHFSAAPKRMRGKLLTEQLLQDDTAREFINQTYDKVMAKKPRQLQSKSRSKDVRKKPTGKRPANAKGTKQKRNLPSPSARPKW